MDRTPASTLNVSVSCVMRPQFPRQGFLVPPARDADRLEPHLHRVLHSEMTETAEAKHRHHVAGPRTAVPKRVVSRDARAHQRCGFHRGQILRHQCQRHGGSKHVIGITAVEGNAGDLEGDLTAEEIAAPAGIAMTAMTAMPARAHALARFPLRNPRAHGIHRPVHFMAGNARVLQPRPKAFLHQGIAVTDAARLDFDPHPAGGGLWDFAFNNFKRPVRADDLCGTHLGHKQFLVSEKFAIESATFRLDDNRQRSPKTLTSG